MIPLTRSTLMARCLALVITLFTVLLSACAQPIIHQPPPAPALVALEEQQQRSLVLQHRLDRQQRLFDLSLPLLSAASDLCGDRTRYSLGFRFSNKQAIEAEYQDSAIRDLGLGDALQVLLVAAQSPASQAGLLPGDILVALDQQPFKTGKNAAAQTLTLFTRQLTEQPSTLSISRQGRLIELAMTPVQICNYPIRVASTDEVNAYADGANIILTQGMLRFAAKDHELALVIAHELAHNSMGHVDKTIHNALAGSLLDLAAWSYGLPSPGIFTLAGSHRYLQPFELEADYLALYLLARSGFAFEHTADFWRRMATEYPDQVNTLNHSHPSSVRRFLAMEATIEEIRHKQRANIPLTPLSQDGPQQQRIGQPPSVDGQ